MESHRERCHHQSATVAKPILQNGRNQTIIMMSQPLVSILIPAFNSQETIAETLQSAQAQTWPRKEIILVDDGSTDRTLEIANRFESAIIKVVTQPNQGAAAARNLAFSMCRGDYIQWLDADDLLAPDKIALQLKALGQNGSHLTLLTCSWGKFMYRVRKATFIPTALWGNLSPAEWLYRKLQYNFYMQPGTWLVSRKLTELAGPWDQRLLIDDDGEYFCRVLMASNGVQFVPEAKVYYRTMGSNRLSNITHSPQKQEAQFLSLQLHIKYLLSLEDSMRTRTACLTLLQTWLYAFYPQRLNLVADAILVAESLSLIHI